MSNRNKLFKLVLVLLCIGAKASAQTAKQCAEKAGSNDRVSCNGIGVGEPKVFDNRSLTLQLESLSKALSDEQKANGVFNLKAVAAALNNIQGLSQTET